MFSQNLCAGLLARFAVFHEKQDLLLQLLLSKAPSPYARAANRQHHSVSGVSADPGWSEVKGSKAVVAAVFSCSSFQMGRVYAWYQMSSWVHPAVLALKHHSLL